MMLWLDTETTGTDYKKGLILEVALIITDNKLNEVARFESVIHHDQSAVDRALNPWARANHDKSGLLDLVEQSRASITEVENELVELTRMHCPKDSRAILCGASIHFDRDFLKTNMPIYEALLSSYTYRMLDVSSLKEAWLRYLDFSLPQTPIAHRAMMDIESTMSEYRKYLATVKV